MDVHYSSKDITWTTPAWLLKKVVTVLGTIDLDPCAETTTDRNPNVPASHHFTADDDGLSKDWFGNVFMNPPYGTGISHWINKLVREIDYGRVNQAIALLPARTDTEWFDSVFSDALSICFLRGRLYFNEGRSPAPFPSVVVYFEPFATHLDSFQQQFNEYGAIIKTWLV